MGKTYKYVAGYNGARTVVYRRVLTTVQVLVTQPMIQCRTNWTELRSMDSYIQILCRFQKFRWKVPPPSLLSYENFWNLDLDIRIHQS